MKRYKTLFETLRLPLKLLFAAFIFIGIGYLIQNENVNIFYTITNPYVLIFAECLNRIGSFIIINFPLILIVKLVARKTNSSIPIISGIIGYVAFLILTMVFASTDLPSTTFSAILGITYNASKIPNLATGTRYPIQMGIIAALIIGFCTRISYSESRRRNQYSLFSFIDKDTWAILINILYCSIAGLIMALLWPTIYKSIQIIIDFIASDVTNPMSMFVYGLTDRVLSILGIGNLIRYPFWFQSQGGTWLSIAGESFAGDVNVWSAMVSQGAMSSGFGRFITPYYVTNMFAIPGLMVGLYTLYSDKMEKRRIRLFLILSIVVSILTGCQLPVELALLLLSPLLLVIHLVIQGALFGVFQGLNVFLGFKYSGSTLTALPGSLPDFLIYIRDPNYARTIQIILIIGIICFFIYYFVTHLYFKYMAYDLFNTGQSKKLVEGFIIAVGGIENIKLINASPLRLTVQVFDIRLINFDHIQRLGATKVVETRAGFAMSFGSSSVIIRKLVLKKIKNSKR